MAPHRKVRACAGLLLGLCSLAADTRSSCAQGPIRVAAPRGSQTTQAQAGLTRLPPVTDLGTTVSGDGLFAGQPELSIEQLTDFVFQRNASLEAMTLAWRAAQQRYPQAIALDDPTFMAMAAPASFSSNTTQSAYVLGGAQKLPWFGKRDARGAVAQADANAMFHDVQDARLQLEQSARMAFYEYYLVTREVELNRQNLELTREFRVTAQSKYENNLVTQQDVLQADLESATTERRLLELTRMRRIAAARINTLLRRTPDEWLPAPPRELATAVQLPAADLLRQMAVGQRPDLAAVGSRVRAEQAAVDLAMKQFYPDTEIYGKYDSFWQPAATQSPLRGQVGINMNVPIYRKKLNAAVCEAQFKLAQRQAEYRQKVADVQFEIESAYAQVLESQQSIEIYRAKLLPASENSVNTARSNYDVGKTTFLNLLSAQQQFLMQREQYQQALAAYNSRLADLERALGGPLPTRAQPDALPTPPPRDGSAYRNAIPARPARNAALPDRSPRAPSSGKRI
jgi:outer membrane protein, heavy metal efflux system